MAGVIVFGDAAPVDMPTFWSRPGGFFDMQSGRRGAIEAQMRMAPATDHAG
jgi:hypothetical protein